MRRVLSLSGWHAQHPVFEWPFGEPGGTPIGVERKVLDHEVEQLRRRDLEFLRERFPALLAGELDLVAKVCLLYTSRAHETAN